jgi:16S rRNA (adenine1518-N6/adenine1519-N6)-dimethyltransferase
MIQTVRPRKSLGQHFLIDDNIARNIVRDVDPSPEDIVVEIGPGQGALTRFLAPKVRKLIAVEIDDRVVDRLRTQFSQPHVEIVHSDFLDFDLTAVSKREGGRLRLVGNIPYYLTSEILIKALDERSAVQDITIMLQREVAQRLAAKPGSKKYGILSVYAQFYGTMNILFNVSPNCFFPKPKVSSTVVQERLFKKIPFNVDEKIFRTVVRTAFGNRRKTLRNALKNLPFDEAVYQTIRTLPLMDKRPEQLSVKQFVELTQYIEENLRVLA